MRSVSLGVRWTDVGGYHRLLSWRCDILCQCPQAYRPFLLWCLTARCIASWRFVSWSYLMARLAAFGGLFWQEWVTIHPDWVWPWVCRMLRALSRLGAIHLSRFHNRFSSQPLQLILSFLSSLRSVMCILPGAVAQSSDRSAVSF